MNIDILLLDTPFGLTCPWWWLWSLGAFILGILVSCFIFGWCRYGRRIGELEAERDQYHLQFTDMEKQYMGLKYQVEEAAKDNTALRASLNKCESDKTVLKVKLDRLTAEASEAVGSRGMVTGTAKPVEEKTGAGINYGDIFQKDNLQIIEGIGAKIEDLLKEVGLSTWSALAAASYDDLKQILEEAGSRYRMHDPKSWSQQAQLAAAGKWAELIELQKSLGVGGEEEGAADTPSKLEKMGMKILGFSNNPEDLKIIEGIGPKIEGLLKEAGIRTWSDLAEAPLEKLQAILDKAGDRYRLADPATWSRQAGLAAAGKWTELSEYQDFLQGGKDPDQ